MLVRLKDMKSALWPLTIAAAIFIWGCDSPSSSDTDNADMTRIEVEDAGTNPLLDGAPDNDDASADQGAPSDAGSSDAIVDAAEEWDPLTINSLVPNRGPVGGGTEVRIIGSGFMGDISVLMAGQPCGDVRVESTNHLRCVTPAVPPGTAPVTVVRINPADERQTATLEDGFTFFEDVALAGVMPDRIPVRGGSELVIAGTGLIEGTRISVGGNDAENFTINGDGTVSVVAPPGQPGSADLTATNFNGSSTLPGAVFYFEELLVNGLSPPAGPLTGGTQVVISGRGLAMNSRVSFGQNGAEVQATNADRTELTVNTPAGQGAGLVDILVENENGTFELPDGFIYFDDLANGYQVAGIAPTRGPLDGGNAVWVAGNGFTEGTTVHFDGRLVDCEFVDANQLRCIAPPGVEGPVPVTVTENGETLDVAGGYTYFQSLELIAILPDQGSVAGGTLVTISGIGFSADVDIFMGEVPLNDMQIIDDTTIVGVTPPNTPGPVDVRGSTEFSHSTIGGGFTYFDPSADFGGVWGEPIQNTINVTVIDGATGQPMASPDMDELNTSVHIQNPETAFVSQGITNAQGQITFSDPALTGPINVTAAKQGYEATTIEDVGVQNITIILFPNDGEGDPPPPVPAAILRGVVSGLDALPKPVNEIYVNIIVVETTHSSPYNRSRLPPPGPGGMLMEDGPYEIIARPGEVAVIATAGEINRNVLADFQAGNIEYWDMRRSLNPLAMGIRRFVSASPGDTIGELDIEIDHPMDLSFPVDLDNPPAGADPGPRLYAVLPRLNFGPEGYWELDTQAVSLQPNLNLRNMPRLDGWPADLTYMMIGLAYSATPSNMPYSVSIQETRDVEAGLLITPFVGSAFVIDPEPESQLGAGRVVTWGVHDGFEGPIRAPSANLILIEEPALGPPKPLWRYVTPSLVTQFQFPDLPLDVGTAGLGQGVMFLVIQPFILDGEEFNFEDFTYNDLAQYRWKSWGQTMTVFTR